MSEDRTDTLPEVEEPLVGKDLRAMSEDSRYDIAPSVRAALFLGGTIIDQLQRDNAALREGLNICKFWFAGYADNGGKGATEELAMCQALLNPSNTGGR